MGCCVLWLHFLRLVVYEDEESAEVALRKLPNTELDSRKLYLRKVGLAGHLAYDVMGSMRNGVGRMEEEDEWMERDYLLNDLWGKRRKKNIFFNGWVQFIAKFTCHMQVSIAMIGY